MEDIQRTDDCFIELVMSANVKYLFKQRNMLVLNFSNQESDVQYFLEGYDNHVNATSLFR